MISNALKLYLCLAIWGWWHWWIKRLPLFSLWLISPLVNFLPKHCDVSTSFFWCDQDNRNHPPVLLCRDDELASFSWCSGFAFSLISFDAPWCSWCTGCRYQGPLPPHTPTSSPIPLGSALWVLPFGKLWHLQIRPATLSDVAKSELIFLFMVGAKKPARHH